MQMGLNNVPLCNSLFLLRFSVVIIFYYYGKAFFEYTKKGCLVYTVGSNSIY